jgi:hypothetical protein
MKLTAWLGVVVGVLAVGWLFHRAEGQNYARGAQCITSANCANCLIGTSSDSSCSSGYRCTVYQSGTSQSTFKECVRSSNPQHMCTFGQPPDPAITCQSMSFYTCGCQQGGAACDYSASSCVCSGTPGGSVDVGISTLCAS